MLTISPTCTPFDKQNERFCQILGNNDFCLRKTQTEAHSIKTDWSFLKLVLASPNFNLKRNK